MKKSTYKVKRQLDRQIKNDDDVKDLNECNNKATYRRSQ